MSVNSIRIFSTGRPRPGRSNMADCLIRRRRSTWHTRDSGRTPGNYRPACHRTFGFRRIPLDMLQNKNASVIPARTQTARAHRMGYKVNLYIYKLT